MKRNLGWSVVRYSEFAVLVLSVILAAIENIEAHPMLVSPRLLAALALASKLIRAVLTLVGQQSSTVSLTSWIVAIILAATTVLLPGAGVRPPSAGLGGVPDAVEVNDATTDIMLAPDTGPVPDGHGGGSITDSGAPSHGDAADSAAEPAVGSIEDRLTSGSQQIE